MKDVAAVAGVSLSTVSRVVNGSPPVAAELAVKVEHAIELLGYRHNHTAGTLRRANGHSHSIGLIFDDVANPFFAAIHRGVEDVARTRGVVTFAGSSDADAARERELSEAVLARRVDGLILVPTGHDHEYLARDLAAGTALVFVDRPPESINCDCVLSDNRAGAAAAVAHLVEHGHELIAYVGPPPDLYTSVERLAGYRDAIVGPQIVHHEVSEAILEGVTAIFSAQNLVTIEVLRLLHRTGRQHEIAHVGFDDVPLANAVDPGLTVVAQDALGLGHAAAELLFERIDGFTGPSRRVMLPTPLIARGSGEIQARS